MQAAPALVRDGFMQGRDPSSVFTFIKGNMRADNAGSEELTSNPTLLKAVQIVPMPN